MSRPALLFRFLVLLLPVLLAVPGCPRLSGKGDFLSAVPGGYGRGTDFIDSPTAGAPEGDGDTAGGEEVREVVEPDVIRQSGSLLYVLNQYRGLSIVDLDSETLLSQTATTGFPRDLYVVGNRAYVLVAQPSSAVYLGDVASFGVSGTMLHVLDISNPAAPEVLASLELDGDLTDSRLVGDVLYTVGAQFSYYGWPVDEVPGGGAVGGSPGREGDAVPPGGFAKQQTSASWVSSVDVSNPDNVRVVDTLSFDGYGDVIQATNQAIFVAGHSWENDSATITYVDISDPDGEITVRGNVELPGRIADRFKMDAWNGVLRVVSNTGWPTRSSYVSTVSLADPDALALLGQTTIPGAENETLFATRFDGPRAYAVTYFMVDPLFVLDLSDPAKPTVAGSLEVPGWSTHIEPRGDRLIALGVDDTNGRRVSVSLFDVSNPAAPALLSRESFGSDWSWSNAYSDVKSFTVLDDVIIVPFGGWSETGGYDRLQFLSYTRDGIDARGHVDLRGQALRSFEFAGHYYGVTPEEVAIIDGANLDAPQQLGRIVLAENIADYLPLEAPGAKGVALIQPASYNSILLRAEDAEGNTLSEVELPGAYSQGASTNGSVVALESSTWDGNQMRTTVKQVDFSDPAKPVHRTPLVLDMWPAYRYGWIDYPYAVGAAMDIAMPWYPVGTASVVAGDYLVIHGQRYRDGNAATEEVLAVVNLGTGALQGIVGLPEGQGGTLLAHGGQVLVHTQDDAGANLFGQRFLRNYVQLFNPATLAFGDRANVPGEPVAYDGSILTLDDWQYGNGFSVQRQLRTARWDGGDGAEAIASAPIGDTYGTLAAGGGYVFAPAYDAQFQVKTWRVASDGGIEVLAPLASGSWGNILAADSDGTLYLAKDGNTLLRYTEPGTWDLLGEPVSLTSWVSTVRFGEDTAFLPMGYAGLLELPR